MLFYQAITDVYHLVFPISFISMKSISLTCQTHPWEGSGLTHYNNLLQAQEFLCPNQIATCNFLLCLKLCLCLILIDETNQIISSSVLSLSLVHSVTKDDVMQEVQRQTWFLFLHTSNQLDFNNYVLVCSINATPCVLLHHIVNQALDLRRITWYDTFHLL